MDNMPAYRVYDFEQRGVIRQIPFVHVVTHEGHFPFRDFSKWSDEEKAHACILSTQPGGARLLNSEDPLLPLAKQELAVEDTMIAQVFSSR